MGIVVYLVIKPPLLMKIWLHLTRVEMLTELNEVKSKVKFQHLNCSFYRKSISSN